MKTMKKSILLVVVLLAFAAVASAQVVTSTTATATIVGPLVVVKTADLAFGKIAPGAGAVTVTPAAVRSTTGPLLMGGLVTAASFNVTGDNSAAYAITFSTGNTLTGPGAPMPLGTFIENATNTLSVTGAETFQVGATLTVGAAQVVGAYTGTFDVIVAYN